MAQSNHHEDDIESRLATILARQEQISAELGAIVERRKSTPPPPPQTTREQNMYRLRAALEEHQDMTVQDIVQVLAVGHKTAYRLLKLAAHQGHGTIVPERHRYSMRDRLYLPDRVTISPRRPSH